MPNLKLLTWPSGSQILQNYSECLIKYVLLGPGISDAIGPLKGPQLG